MSRRQLLALFVCLLVPWTAGNGVLPLLPIVARELGASPAIAGAYLSISYLALAFGTVVAGWYSDRIQRRKGALIVVGVLLVPSLWLLGFTRNVVQLTALTAFVWFLAGTVITLINILTGLFAEPERRGRIFGTLALSSGLGALIGGLLTGSVADRWGFPAMFAAIALVSVALPIAALFLEDRAVPRPAAREGGERRGPGLATPLLFLLAASVFASVSVFAGRFGTSLVMDGLRFSSGAIASTGSVGGLVTLPLAPLVGWLSDRFGRRPLLMACYLTGGVGLALLATAASLWHFWAVASLISVLAYVSSGVGSALVTDLAPPERLGRSMSLFTTTSWVGGIVGFVATGAAVQALGVGATFVGVAMLPVVGVALLAGVRRRG